MKVNSSIVEAILTDKKPNKAHNADIFEELLVQKLKTLKEDQKVQNEIEKFKQDLQDMGAYGVLSGLNEQKIADKIEQKRKELIEALQINSISDPVQKAQAISSIDEILSEYKRQLYALPRQNNRLAELTNNLNGATQSNNTLASLLAQVGL